MAPHSVVRRSLAAYAVGAVDDQERVVIEEHLETCAACRAEAAELQEVAVSSLSPDEDPPPEVWSQVSRAIRERQARTPPEPDVGDEAGPLEHGHAG